MDHAAEHLPPPHFELSLASRRALLNCVHRDGSLGSFPKTERACVCSESEELVGTDAVEFG